jgi:hypothetical protein
VSTKLPRLRSVPTESARHIGAIWALTLGGLLCTLSDVAIAAAPRMQDPKPAPAPVKPLDKTKDPLAEEKEKLILSQLDGWKTVKIKSLDEVVDPKKTTTPLEYPATVTDEQKAKMGELLQKAKDGQGGASTNRALKELRKMGLPALFFLANQLREINYKDADDSMWAFQLNQSMQEILMGVNVGYAAVEIGESIDPRKAQWNSMTVKNWHDAIKSRWDTQEKFDTFIKNRKAKKDADLEGETKGAGAGEPAKKAGG